MTGYHISIGIGYQSGSPGGKGNWEDLKSIANNITEEELRKEYLEYEIIIKCEDITIDDFVSQHFKAEDATITFIEDKEGEEQIMLLASGGGCDCRAMKEGLRRAFCRLMLQKSHKQHIEININVG